MAIISWSPVDNRVALAENNVVVKIRDGQSFALITALGSVPHCKQLTTLTWNHNGEVIAGGFSDGKVIGWNTTTGIIAFKFQGEVFVEGIVQALLFNHDSSKLTSISGNGTVKKWDIVIQTQIFEQQLTAPVFAAIIDLDSKYIIYDTLSNDSVVFALLNPDFILMDTAHIGHAAPWCYHYRSAKNKFFRAFLEIYSG